MRFTFGDILDRAARRRPDKPAIAVAGDRVITYRTLFREASRLAARLRSEEGAHVGLLLPNSADWVVCLFGIALAGKTAVLLNTRLTTAELTYQIGQSDTSLLLTGPLYGRDGAELMAAVATGCPACKRAVWWGDSAPPGSIGKDDWLGDIHEPTPARGQVAEDAPAVIIYTSGTTSLPKGVVLSHYSVIVNAFVVGQSFGVTDQDRVFSAGPFFHSGGLTMHIVLAVLFGATACSISYFEPSAVLEAVERHQCTIYNGIETLFLRLMDAPDFDRRRVRSVRTGWATGSRSVLHRIAAEVGMPGIVGVYGISEASPNVLISHFRDTPEHRLDTVGKPQPWIRVQVQDLASGAPVPDGEIGELVISGYSLMKGYYNKPEETDDALRGGWLHTGDLVRRRPDGFFEFAGRAKDIIRVGGENVSALEVENVLHTLPGVGIAAVVPVDDSTYGEIPVAVIKVTEGARLQEAAIMDVLKRQLASYKLPRRIVFRDRLPLTESGKVQKAVLRQSITAQGKAHG